MGIYKSFLFKYISKTFVYVWQLILLIIVPLMKATFWVI
jgi:hypothetical protein